MERLLGLLCTCESGRVRSVIVCMCLLRPDRREKIPSGSAGASGMKNQTEFIDSVATREKRPHIKDWSRR